jgi:hypothetical protein
MEKIINKLINEFTKGVDTYTHNGSTWLIFTDTKHWVIELTNAKTLWYNYHFFKGMFSYASLDCVQNQHLITKWVEDNIINGVKHTGSPDWNRDKVAKYAIQNGVKKIKGVTMKTDWSIDDTIQNGIKKTEYHKGIRPSAVENSILNGVKRTQNNPFSMITNVENTIQNGVKETNPVDVMKFFDNKMEDTIQNGVKSSNPRQYVDEDIIDRIIGKSIIETHEDVYHHKGRIDGVIKNGVKEIKPLPAQTGNRDWSEYYHGREDRTKPFNDYLNDTLEMGVKIK